MPTRHPLTVSLTPELARLVAAEVASGHYGSASEVIRAGLRLLAGTRPVERPIEPGSRSAPRRVGVRAVRAAAAEAVSGG